MMTDPSALDLAKDYAQLVFYSVGVIAVVFGGPFAFRRFLFERPYEQSWDHSVTECRVRGVGESGFRYLYHSLVVITNRSKSWQVPTRAWALLALPGEEQFDKREPFRVESEEAADLFFGSFGTPFSFTAIGPDETFRFGEAVRGPSLVHALRVYYCFEVRNRRLFLPGFHKSLAYHTSSQFVPVNLADIQHYSEDGESVNGG